MDKTKNIKDLFTIGDEIEHYEHYELSVEGDMNDGDYREDNHYIPKDQWDASKPDFFISLIALEYAAENGGHIDDLPDVIKENIGFVPYDGAYEGSAHTITNCSLIYCDEGGVEHSVDIPSIGDGAEFETIEEFEEYVKSVSE